jgi:N-acetylmuramoyl-L-alanine amidase
VDSGTDTESLQGSGATAPARGARAHGTARATAPGPHSGGGRRRQRAALAALLLGAACGKDASLPGGDDGAAARAQALLAVHAALPGRDEVAAVTEQVAIAASREGKSAEGARLSRLAAELRTRAWRFDGTASDASRALELYGEAAARSGGEDGCQADRRRALLAGELAHDAAQSYRELYLARRRQAARLGGDAATSPCLAAIDLSIAQAVAFRPSGEALRALEREGNGAAEASARPGTSAAPAVGTTAPVVVGSAGNLVVSPAEGTVPKGPVKMTSIEKYGGDKGGRVVIHLDGPAAFQVGSLPADDAAGKDARIFVDVARASSRGVARETEVGGVIRRVRVGAREGGTRVVLDLTATPFRRVFYLPQPFRIVVDISTRPPGAAQGTAGGPREVRRVALDAGHGGVDAGAVGPTGLREKDVTLDVAHRAAPLLAHELKVETLLTRDSDTFVPLDARTARANAFHADLFISIHCNASESGTARGVQTFYLAEAKEQDAFAIRLAARENQSAVRGGKPPDPQALDGEMAAILGNLNVGDMAARSRHFADLLQRSALASASQRYPDMRDQGVKTAGFFVLAGADMPAALFETAFISNPEDEARLATADFRQKMADAIVNAVRAFREGK